MEYRTGAKGTLGAQKRESKSSIRRVRMSEKFLKPNLPDLWMRVGGVGTVLNPGCVLSHLVKASMQPS